MKFIKAITSGTSRTLRASKQILILWVISLLSIALLMVPFRNILMAYAGSSMATEMLAHGNDISYWIDFGSDIQNILGSFAAGLMTFIGISFLLNIFLSGGLFDKLRVTETGYRVRDFFSASAKLFFPFLWVNLLVILIILTSAFIFIGIPVLVVKGSGANEEVWMSIAKIMRFAFLFIVLIYLLVADYARAWLAASDKRNVFRAVGYGFKATFTSFVNSYLFIIVAVALQTLFVWLSITLLEGMEPQTGGGLFLLFILSQLLLIIRIYLRAFRYAGVTSLYAIG